MNRWLTSLIFCFIPVLMQAQQNLPLGGWDNATLARANTAGKVTYMTDEEKQVILLTNLARLDGPLFVKTILADWMKHEKASGYTRSLEKELKSISGLPPLYPRKDLYDIAFRHAVKSGKKGTTGHQGFKKRFKPVMGKYNRVGENCAYGFNQAENIVLGLLVDEGIQDLGHRKNMLNADFDSLGVSIQQHRTFTYNCVMDFGGK